MKRIKPWPTSVYLRLPLSRPCVHLRWLAITCTRFGRNQISTQFDARFSLFGHPNQVNTSWVNWILSNGLIMWIGHRKEIRNLPLYSQVEWCQFVVIATYKPINLSIKSTRSLQIGFFATFCVLARKLASLFGHPMQVSRQVQLVTTCDYLTKTVWPRLTFFSYT